jgi:hypothetical protein
MPTAHALVASVLLVQCAAGLQLTPNRLLSISTAPARPRITSVVMQGGEDEAAKRAESGKAAVVSLLAGTAGSLPFLLLDPGAFSSPQWEFQADGL